MKHPRSVDPRWRIGRILACAGLVISALGAPTCTTAHSSGAARKPSGASPSASAPDGAPVPAGAALRTLAERERRKPVESARQAPPVAGIDSASIAPLAQADIAKARTPTPEAVAAIANLLPDPRPTAPRVIDEATQQEALRAYVVGRSARLAEDLKLAMDELERSAKLDPNPPEPWREMAEVYLTLGDRHAAEQAFQRSFERDPSDPLVLERTALLPPDGKTSDAVAGALARLMSVAPDQLDPAMPYLVPAGLGRVLLERGYVAAGVELLARAVDLPTSFGEATNFREELSDLYRRRGEVYRDAGDGLMRLGDVAGALTLYEDASDLPLIDPDALLGRRVAAMMRMGHPSEAALAVIGSIERRGGMIRDGHVALLRSIAASSDTGPAIVEALREDEALATVEVARASRSTRVRAIAALLPSDQARAFLRDEVVATGGDAALITQLYGQLDPATDDSPIHEAIVLTARDPLSVDRFVDGLLALGPDLNDTLAKVQSAPLTDGATRPAMALVQARVLVLLGRFPESLAALETITGDDDVACAAALARIRVLLALGKFDEASALLNTFDPGTRVTAIVAKAALLADEDKTAEGLELLESIEQNKTVRDWELAQIHLTAARLLTNTQRYTEAADEFRRVLILDPTSESAHAGLIALYITGGPLADEARLVEALRALRDSAPESRTFRLLRARDAVSRGRTDLAEKDLVALAAQYPDDPAIIELLVTVWLQQDHAAQAEAWLRECLTRMPGNRTDTLQLARLLVRTERPRDAAELLAQWLARSPADEAISRYLESIYRDALQDPSYAAQLARERLAKMPVSVDTLGETAVLQLQDFLIEPAAQTVHQMLDLSASTGRSVAQWGNPIAGQIEQMIRDSTIVPSTALRILTDLTDHAAHLSDNVYLLRVLILGESDVPVDEMIKGADLAADRAPALHDRAYSILLEQLRHGDVIETKPPPHADMPEQQRVRRPLNSAQDVREETLRIADRNALAIAVIDHLRATRPLPVTDRIAAYAVDVACRAVGFGRQDLAPRLSQFVDEMLARADKETIVTILAQLAIGIADQQNAAAISAEQRAELLNDVSDTLHSVKDDARADTISRLAIAYDPENVTANNNLGYRLLQRDESLDEAISMIEKAYHREPDAAHIIDSMAWAMYKAGIVHDEFDNAGAMTRLGAVTLLKRALTTLEHRNTPDNIFNLPILFDHYGDAQWAAGDHEGALASWRESLRTGEGAISPEMRRRLSTVGDSTFDEVESAVKIVRQKVAAAEEGKDPPVSRILRTVNTVSPNAPSTPDTMVPEPSIPADAPRLPAAPE